MPQDNHEDHSDHHILWVNKAGSPKDKKFWGKTTLEVFHLKPPKNYCHTHEVLKPQR